MDRGALLRTADTAFTIVPVRCLDPSVGKTVGNGANLATHITIRITGMIVGVFRQPVNVEFPCSVADGTGMQPDAFICAGRPFCNGTAVPCVVINLDIFADSAFVIMCPTILACPTCKLMRCKRIDFFGFGSLTDSAGVGFFTVTDAGGLFGDHAGIPGVVFCFAGILVADSTDCPVKITVRYPFTFAMGQAVDRFCLCPAAECAGVYTFAPLTAGGLPGHNTFVVCTLSGLALTADSTLMKMAGR